MKIYNESGVSFNLDETKEISRGGEGRIIELSSDQVVKLYLTGIKPITNKKFNDLSVLDENIFVKPLDLVKDSKSGPIIGFIMKMVANGSFPLSAAFNNNFITRNRLDNNWKLEISNKIIKGVKSTHDKNIAIGDLSGYNIMANDKADVSFIDVDSYQTANGKHSGKLLDDIRDYQKNGEISQESDYFSMAVVLFHLLTNVHPFKGIHQQVKGLADRMIAKLPVFANDPGFKLPKCYNPIKDKYLLEQFHKIFIDGDRFLLSFDKNISIQVTKAVATNFDSDSLNILLICDGILDVKGSSNIICLIKKDKVLELNVSAKGIYNQRRIVDTNDLPIPTNERVYYFSEKEGMIYYFDKVGKQYIKGLELREKVLAIKQYNNILVIVTYGQMYTCYLNQVYSGTMKIDVINVYGKAVKNYDGLVYDLSGTSYVFYESNTKTGSFLNKVKFPVSIKNLFIKDNIGIVQYIEKNKVIHKLFIIDGMNVKLFDTNYDKIRVLGNKLGAFAMIANDDEISILRQADLNTIAKFECNLIDEETNLYDTNAGIIAHNDRGVFLINKK